MKRIRLVLCALLTISMLAGDISVLAAGIMEAGATVSGNDEEPGDLGEGEVSGGDIVQPQPDITVSENEINDVSGGDITVSGNDCIDPEDTEFPEEAEAALKELTASGCIMALVYLKDSYQVRSEPDPSSQAGVAVKSGQPVVVRDVKVTEGTVWYRAELDLEGEKYEGYLERDYLAYSDGYLIQWEEEYLLPWLEKAYSGEKETFSLEYRLRAVQSSDSSGYRDIDRFPKSYWGALTALKKKYPKWQFVKDDVTGLKFNDVVNAQHGERSYIVSSAPEAYRDQKADRSGWYYASKEGIAYYLDPRNHLTEKEIFQFELLSYNSYYHTEGMVKNILASTFMKGTLPREKRTYARAFMDIATSYNMSPIYLANRVIGEQGAAGGSALISGKYKDFEGYYNHFALYARGSTDRDVIVNGLNHARSHGWNTVYGSLSGGAVQVNDGYIRAGQNTLYYQKFQVFKTNASNLYVNQYIQNIQAPVNEGAAAYNAYNGAGFLNNGYVFRIPVYAFMPTNSPDSIKSITISEKEHTLTITQEEVDGNLKEKQESFQLTAKVIDENDVERSDYPVEWTSSNPKVAKVKNGKVTSVMGGKATITAKAGDKTAKCVVTVKAPLYGMEIIPPSGEIYVGNSVKLNVKYVPAHTSDPVEKMVWTSSNKKVAVVTNGLVTGMGAGTATVTASVTGEDGKQFSAEYRVTVKECVVNFYRDNGTVWSTYQMKYGQTLKGRFPDAESLAGHGEDVFSGWYTEPGGAGRLCGESTVVYGSMDIYPYFISTRQDFFVKNVGDQVYTGQAIKPEVEVYDGKLLLVKGQDYTVSYSNNKAAAGIDSKKKPTIIVKGKGNYTGTQKIYFNILKKDIGEADITAQDLLYAYTGNKIKPVPAVYRDGKKLKKGIDFTLEYSAEGKGAYIASGIFPIEIKGCRNYTGTKRIYLTITDFVPMSKVSVAKIKNQEYDEGKELEPELKVKYKGKELVLGEDYEVSWHNNREIGTASVTLTAIEDKEDGIYRGSKTVTFKITGIPMKKVKVSGIKAQTYSGEPITIYNGLGVNSGYFPDFSITGPNGVLKLGEDYNISYKNNTQKGTATILFTGIKKYTGTLKKTFKIGAYDLNTNPKGYIYLESDNLGVQEYGRAGTKPGVRLYFRGADGKAELLKEKEDYTLTYKNNKDVNDGKNPDKRPTVTIKGKGRFKGTWKEAAYFSIGPKNIGAAYVNGISVKASDFVFTEGIEDYPPKIVVKDQGKTLKEGKDYKIASYRIVNYKGNGIMNYEAVLEALEKPDGSKEYTGTRTVTYKVYSCSLAKAGIRLTPSKIPYDDKTANSKEGICPEAVVTYKIKSDREAGIFNTLFYEKYDTKNRKVIGKANGSTIVLKKGDTVLLKEDRDYVFHADSYENNKKTGTAKVTVYGMELFAGSKTAKYQITGRPLRKS